MTLPKNTEKVVVESLEWFTPKMCFYGAIHMPFFVYLS